MKASKDKPVVIVGGGITGLTLAHLLLQKGIPVTVIEKDPEPGGLARSFRYNDFTFDIGPHRFHTDNAKVQKYILKILGSDYLTIPRSSVVKFKDRFYPWPIHPSYELLKFPTKLAFSVAMDLFSLFRKKPVETFKDQIVNMYGKTLYRHFFEGYSSKFLGIVPELTHPDWASTGIDRAIIDKRLKIHSLWQLIKNVITNISGEELKFIYPEGGCGRFTDIQARAIKDAGGTVIYDAKAKGLKVEGRTIRSLRAKDSEIEPSLVVWSGTIHSLLEGLNQPPPALSYLGLVCYNLMLTRGEPFRFQWSYHGSADVIFSRVSVPQNFGPGNAPSEKRGLCVEVTCREDDAVYNDPNRYLDRLVVDLEREGLLKTEHEIEAVKMERFPWAYPIYRVDYRDVLKKVQKSLAGYDNLIRAGRLGLFWYNNMDHCIEAAFGLADKIEKQLQGN